MLAKLLLVYAVALLIGENLRVRLYGETLHEPNNALWSIHLQRVIPSNTGKKWQRHSGLFILLKQKWRPPTHEWQGIVNHAL